MAYPLARAAFQAELQGRRTDLFLLRGAAGMQVALTNYGARLVQIAVPDGQGGLVDVALGYSSLQGYLQGQPSMGAWIGRWAGRLRNGRLTSPHAGVLRLPINSGPHHHHGGPHGSRFQVFAVDDVRPDGVFLSHVFRSAWDGIPGTVRVQLHVHVAPDNALHLDWRALALDQATPLNLTGHAFFNLAGVGSTHGHVLQVPASRYLPLADDMCPAGRMDAVQGTPFDLRQPRRVGAVLEQAHAQLALAGGLDHYLVLDEAAAARPDVGTDVPLRLAAVLGEPVSGRRMEVWCSAPGVQVYSGHGLKANPQVDCGRGAEAGSWLWRPGDGICLEPMEYPDAPNQPGFPVSWLQPGEARRGSIVYRFGGCGEDAPSPYIACMAPRSVGCV